MHRDRRTALASALVLTSVLVGCAAPGPGTAHGPSPAPPATRSATASSTPAPTAAPADVVIARTLLVADWLRIDATLDNTGAVERVGGDQELADAAGRIREEGWRACDAHPQRGQGPVGWPPRDAELEIRLDPAAWDVVRGELLRWRQVELDLLEHARDEGEATQWRESIRWSEAMVAALDTGTDAPRSGL